MTLRTIRKAIMWLLDSDGELQELRSRKAADDPTAKRDQFYKLLSHDGGVVGFSYRCTCGTRYRICLQMVERSTLKPERLDELRNRNR